MTPVTSPQSPLFSVVIPCFNAVNTVRRALESCFLQSERSVEILLVDDASSDATPALLAELAAAAPADMQVHVHCLQNNGGPARARNFGWDRATGRYLAFLDADDCWDPDKLANIREYLQHNPETLLLGHPHRQLGETRPEPEPARVRLMSYWQLLLRNIAQTSCIVVARAVTLRFDTDMRYTEDHDLWLRLTRQQAAVCLDGLTLTQLGRPQMSPGGLSGRRWAMRKGELHMYIKASRQDVRLLVMLPGLLAFSLLKHLWSLRTQVRSWRATGATT